MNGYVESLSSLESKILSLGGQQHNRGFHGGTFTPGYVRKETGQNYPVINAALDFLTANGLLEKSQSTAFRNGVQLDIDVYKITDRGLMAIEKVRSGAIKIEERAVGSENSGSYGPKAGYPAKGRRDAPDGHDIKRSIMNVEEALARIKERTNELHAKIDIRLSPPTEPEPQSPPGESTSRRPRAKGGNSLKHQAIVLEAVKALAERQKVVLAGDVLEAYARKCRELELTPRGASQVKNIMKRLQAENLLSMKAVGCKALGLDGRGSRVVVNLT